MGKIEAKVGQVVLIDFPFIDNTSSKVRPALVLFSEYGNIILAAITSNKKASGIKLTKADGLLYDSTIKLNTIFTLPKEMIIMHICDLNQAKRKEVYLKLEEMIKGLFVTISHCTPTTPKTTPFSNAIIYLCQINIFKYIKLAPLMREISLAKNLKIMDKCKTNEQKEFYFKQTKENNRALEQGNFLIYWGLKYILGEKYATNK